MPGKGYRFIAPVESPRRGITPAPEPAPAVPAAPERAGAPSFLSSAGAARGRSLLAVATWAWLGAAAPPGVTLAVLPFENLGGDPEREYLADGLAEDTIASFGQVDPEHLSVIGRTSIMAYKRTRKSLAEIGRELGADYLVEGSIRAEERGCASRRAWFACATRCRCGPPPTIASRPACSDCNGS